MAKATGKMQITNLKEFFKQIEEEYFDEIKYDIIVAAEKEITIPVKKLIEFYIEKTVAYQALTGFFAGATNGADLPAEYGLSPADAEQAANDIARVIIASINIDVGYGKTKTSSLNKVDSLIINLSEKETEERLLLIPNATYTSYGERGTYEIPWMEWLLNGGRVSGASIVYRDNYGVSRSERALMARSRYAQLKGGAIIRVGSRDLEWTTTDKFNPIVNLIENVDLQNELASIVENAFQNAVDKFNKTNV